MEAFFELTKLAAKYWNTDIDSPKNPTLNSFYWFLASRELKYNAQTNIYNTIQFTT